MEAKTKGGTTKKLSAPTDDQIHPNNNPPPRPDLPIYTMEEISEHTEEDSMWFTFRGGVYDMTPFAQGHPGGFPVRVCVCVCVMKLHKSPTDAGISRVPHPIMLWTVYGCVYSQRLMMAAGQDLESYWDVYRQHLRGHVVEWIEKYRIGSISAKEAAANKKIPFGGAYTVLY